MDDVPSTDLVPVEEDTSVYLADLPLAPAAVTRRRIGGLTSVLAVVVVAGLGFLAGVKVQQHQGGSGSGTTPNVAAFAAARQGQQGTGRTGEGLTGPGRFGSGGGAGGTTVGQVKLVDGDTIYVTTTSGDIVKVRTGEGSTITRADAATVEDVRPGDTVAVQGEAGADGTVEATRVTDSGSAQAARAG
jgi:endonuclease YncB( thermonuclease family)